MDNLFSFSLEQIIKEFICPRPPKSKRYVLLFNPQLLNLLSYSDSITYNGVE